MKISTVHIVPARSEKYRVGIPKLQAAWSADGPANSIRDIHRVTSETLKNPHS